MRPTSQIIIELKEGRLLYRGQPKRIELSRLSWAISAAAIRTPWRSDCLLQAMAAERWLRRHGHASQFKLGIAKDAHGQFRAHAWLTSQDQILTGGDVSKFELLLTSDAK